VLLPLIYHKTQKQKQKPKQAASFLLLVFGRIVLFFCGLRLS